MRIVGPNSFGLINNDPGIRLNATLASIIPGVGDWACSPRAAPRRRRARLGGPAGSRHLGLRVGREPGRRLGERPHAVLDRRPGHDDRRPLSRVDGQPAQVLPDRASPRVSEAGHRRLVRRLAVRRPTRAPDPDSRTCLRRPSTPCCDRRGSSASRTSTSFDVAQLTLHQPMPTGDRVAVVGNSDALGSLSVSGGELGPAGDARSGLPVATRFGGGVRARARRGLLRSRRRQRGRSVHPSTRDP